jgi:hypothetical protein
VTDGPPCLASAVVDGLVAICDRPGHRPPTPHYDVELDCAWASDGFRRQTRADLGEAERREAEDAYWAAHWKTGTRMTG